MVAMLNSFTGGPPYGKIAQKLFKVIGGRLDAYSKRIPEGYMEEVLSIANQSGVDPAIMFIYQIMYEVEGLGCTSTIVKGTDGSIYHGRNLDFGLGSKYANHSWELTQV